MDEGDWYTLAISEHAWDKYVFMSSMFRDSQCGTAIEQ